MKYFRLSLLLVLFSFIIAGCGSGSIFSRTNLLANYNINGKSMNFQNYTDGKAATLQIEDYNSNHSNNSTVFDAIASVGSKILSQSSQQKITNAVSTDSMTNYVAHGLKNALVTYLNVKPVKSFNDNPKFITETTLQSCKLLTSKNSVYVKVSAYARIIDRKTGNLIWEDWESPSVPIRKSGSSNASNNNSNSINRTVNKIFGAVQLASLDPQQIQNVVDQAAKQAGHEMGNTLRKDFVKSMQKK